MGGGGFLDVYLGGGKFFFSIFEVGLAIEHPTMITVRDDFTGKVSLQHFNFQFDVIVYIYTVIENLEWLFCHLPGTCE